ncbi:MAG: hypothetical protein M1839_004402 [Geoglossum umbratile]|nr:MAG: hypothetical protein M1839_004402 [Geoglossum umbratile]
MSHRANPESQKDPDLVGKDTRDEEGARAEDLLPGEVDNGQINTEGPTQLEVDRRVESGHATGDEVSAKLEPAAGGLMNENREARTESIHCETYGEGSPTESPATIPPLDGDLLEQTEMLSLDSDPLESSTLTVRPSETMQSTERELRPPAPPPKDEVYLDSTPKTPLPSEPPSRTPSHASSTLGYGGKLLGGDPDGTKGNLLVSLEADAGEKQPSSSHSGSEEGSRSEIQSIMDQFDEEGGGPGVEEVMSPRLGLASPMMGGPIQHPPRKSSLEPVLSAERGLGSGAQVSSGPPLSLESPRSADPLRIQREVKPPVPTEPSSVLGVSSSAAPGVQFASGQGTPKSPMSPSAQHKPQPPEPDPEPDLPFDFHRFLEQLRHKTADPVAKFLRSFLQEFGKKQWMVHEQVKIISDFLAFITNKMAQCEVWSGVSDAEFDNAREGMEKLVMNRLYTQTFSPAIAPPQLVPVAGPKGKRKGPERAPGPGRRGQHQEDVERDEVLAQKVRIYGWVREEHLDIETVGDSGRRFLTLAQQELLKIKTYRAPRDKVICVLNCCKVIFGLLRHSKSDQSADSFVPLLIYVVLQANPDHLVSNVQYILRFRNSEKLGGEAGYYLSSLMGAIQFIENLDRTSLTISDEEFEANVETAVSAIAEKHEEEEKAAMNHVHIPKKSSVSRPEVTPRTSTDVEYSTPKRPPSRDGTRLSSSAEITEEKDAVAGLLRTIQRPLSTIGRMFSEEPSSNPPSAQRSPNFAPAIPPGRHPVETPMPGNTPRLSPAPPPASRNNGEARWQASDMAQVVDLAQKRERVRLSAEESAARQASAETAEAQRIQRAEHADVVETLSGMFPDLDKEVIDDVVRSQQGRLVFGPYEQSMSS